jgi:hypothetical protein
MTFSDSNALKARKRAVMPQQSLSEKLGALQDLPGYWEGTGFSLTARPHFGPEAKNGFYLQLNMLRETIEFTTIGSPVFNRGSVQEDMAIYGVTYMHRVTDAVTGGAIRIEPGMWLNIPPHHSTFRRCEHRQTWNHSPRQCAPSCCLPRSPRSW